MTFLGYSTLETHNATYEHVEIGKHIQTFIKDFGEDCDVILEFDDPDESFSYLFTGTTLALEFDESGINVVDFNIETEEETVVQSFAPDELNKATHWLLTQANQANSNS